jgi:hypothetical protein
VAGWTKNFLNIERVLLRSLVVAAKSGLSEQRLEFVQRPQLVCCEFGRFHRILRAASRI